MGELRWSSQGLRPPVSVRPDRSITPYVICTWFVYRYLFILYVSYSHRIEEHIYCTDLHRLTSALKFRTTPHQYVYAGLIFYCASVFLCTLPLSTPLPPLPISSQALAPTRSCPGLFDLAPERWRRRPPPLPQQAAPTRMASPPSLSSAALDAIEASLSGSYQALQRTQAGISTSASTMGYVPL
jgi:hypothetical protein